MPQAPDFSSMDVGETITGALDFGRWLDTGVTVTSVVSVVAANYLPPTGSAFVQTVGSSQIGTISVAEGGTGTASAGVLQQWQGLNVGVARVTIAVQTSDGQTLIAWAHQSVGTPD